MSGLSPRVLVFNEHLYCYLFPHEDGEEMVRLEIDGRSFAISWVSTSAADTLLAMGWTEVSGVDLPVLQPNLLKLVEDRLADERERPSEILESFRR